MMFRRRFGLLLLATAVVAAVNGGVPMNVAAATNPVFAENQQPGSSAWKLGSLVADDVTQQVKGYASATSVNQSATIDFYVSVNPVQTYNLDIYRMGWYGGLGGRLRLHQPGLPGTTQQVCPADPTTGMIACHWTPSYTLTIPSDWTSGIYLVMLTNSLGFESYIPFVVKDGRPAAFVYQESVNTDQAYNNYPDDHVTGKSLYAFNSYGANTVGGDTRAVKVSFDRPYADNGARMLLTWEIQLVRWLEQSGYDVSYTTDIDTHANGQALLNSKGLLVGGHSEYWSLDMYNAATAARDAGVNLAFFGADVLGWQVRFEASDTGVANRVEVCYKDVAIDPVQGPTTTVQWRSGYLNRPGQTLTGLTIAGEVDFSSNADYVVTNSSHWVYGGTGFKDGDAVHGIVGYEMDRYDTRYPAPSSTSRTLLSWSPFTDTGGVARYSNSSIYQAPSGAWVFASGTMSWSWALDNMITTQSDGRIQQTTANLLSAFLYGAPIVHDLKVVAPASATQGRPFTVSVVAENALGNSVTGYNGTVHFSSSDTSSHATLPADTTLTNGQGSFTVMLAQVGSQTLTVSDAASSLSTTVPVTVNAAPAMLVLAPVGAATATAGAPFSFTVTAEDPFGSVITTYAGVVHFASSDTSTGVTLPPDSTLTNGQGTFTATMIRAGSQTITASDNVGSGSSPTTMTVTAAPASHLVLTATSGSTTTAGDAFPVAVTALDAYGNTDLSYSGTVHFTSTDTSAGVVLPPDSQLTGGQGTFSATLDRAGPQTITGTDTVNASIGGTVTMQVIAAAATSLSIVAPASTVANHPFNVQVTLTDRFGNVAAGYVGNVHFTTTDLLAEQLGKMPADYTFTSADAGSRTFSVTLMTIGHQTITVTDTANSQLTGSSKPIAVSLILL
jgi:hypothetical protein